MFLFVLGTGMHSSAGLALQGRQTHAIQQHQTSSCDSILTARLTHDCIIQPELEEISTGGCKFSEPKTSFQFLLF